MYTRGKARTCIPVAKLSADMLCSIHCQHKDSTSVEVQVVGYVQMYCHLPDSNADITSNECFGLTANSTLHSQ